MGERHSDRRAEQAVRDVLPRSVIVRAGKPAAGGALTVNGQPLRVQWAGAGSLRDVRLVLEGRGRATDIVVARRLSPGARELLTNAGIGWADETGAAEIAVGSIVVSRTGRASAPAEKPKRWTPAVMAVAETLLCGTSPTVAATVAASGLSTGSCTSALRYLSELGLLTADAARGRDSARRVADPDRLLDAYATAVEAAPPTVSLRVGARHTDVLAGLVEAGHRWDQMQRPWAATGAAAAWVIAPYLTTLTAGEVYVDADTIAGLEALAVDAGLRPIEGGRLTLRPFPTVAVRRLSEQIEDLRVAPWPRVYADLRTSGVRGEEAAEHLREVMRDR